MWIRASPWASSPRVKFAEAFGVVGHCEHNISSLRAIPGLREISPRMLTRGTASEERPCREGMGQSFYWAGRGALPRPDSTEL